MATRSRVPPHRKLKVRYHPHHIVELIIVFCAAFVLYCPLQFVIHSSLLKQDRLMLSYLCAPDLSVVSVQRTIRCR